MDNPQCSERGHVQGVPLHLGDAQQTGPGWCSGHAPVWPPAPSAQPGWTQPRSAGAAARHSALQNRARAGTDTPNYAKSSGAPPAAPQPTQSSSPVLSLCLGAAGGATAAIPAQHQSSSPPWGRPRVGTAPGKEQCHIPGPEAAACTGTAASKASDRYFWCPKGSWQHPGWAEHLERDKGS